MAKKENTIIGKDVIEALTLGMYEDSKFIYREYIQNAADQIDKAVKVGLLPSKERGNIYITIDKRSRSIKIYDDATGIETHKVDEILRNIAQSTKEIGVDKGFRGIGRLGGLGYCDELIFTTSFKGEDKKSIMIWDAKDLKQIINDRKTKESASSVIDRVTDFDTEPEDTDKHYFEVELRNVTNDALLNKIEIKKYLSLIAPVPYHNRFMFREKIYNDLKERNLSIDEYTIYVNTDQIFKEYTTSIYRGENNKKLKKDEVFDIETFELKNEDGDILAWGWYSLSKFDGVIPPINSSRGIRLRKDNIQIGSETTLNKLHKQRNNNNYFFGEVYALNPDLIPNARRDYFRENKICLEFEEKLSDFFDKKLKPLFNITSKMRSSNNAIISLQEKKKEIAELNKTGITNKEQIFQIEEELERKKENAEKAKTKLEDIKSKIDKDNDTSLKKIFDKVVNTEKVSVYGTAAKIKKDIESLPHRTEKYSKLTKRERKLISKIFAIVDNVLNKELAENLKQKIDEQFI